MTTLQDKLDNIYQTKLEIKSAIGTDSDVFSEYPAMIRSMSGGGVSYSYLDERLSYYVETSDLESMGYITIEDVPQVDLSSYVTYTYLESKEYLTEIPSTYATYAAISEMGYITQQVLDNAGYITYSYGDSIYVSYAYIGDLNEITEYILGSSSSEAPENVYATKYELGSYVSKDELNNASYITINDVPVVDTSSYVTYTYLESKEYVENSDLNNYLPLSGGEISGQFYVSYSTATTANYGIKSYSHVVAGDHNKTGVTFFATKRKCGGAEGTSYMASFFTNSDGRSKFAHKSQTNNVDVGGEVDDAFMCFNAYGFKIAYSGIQGSSASTEYELIHEGNINNYIPTINETIIPKENNTYTLGDSTYKYAATYTTYTYTDTLYATYIGQNTYISSYNSLYLGTDRPWKLFGTGGGGNESTVLKNDTGGKHFQVKDVYNNNIVDIYEVNSSGNSVTISCDNTYTKSIIPSDTNTYTLGDAGHIYDATYTNAIYTGNISYTSSKTSIKMNDRNLDLWTNNKKLINLSDYNGFVPTQSNFNLGSSNNAWGTTYTNNLYVNGSDIESRIAAIEAYLGLNQ